MLRELAPVALIVGLLVALNIAVVALVPDSGEREQRVRIPYSPVFLAQLRAGNVDTINAKGETVQGTFTHTVPLPDGDETVKTTLFSTEVPTFANADELAALLEAKHVQVNAQPPGQDRPFLETLILSLGPALLIVALLLFVLRRAGGGGGAMLGFGRSTARRTSPDEQQITFRDVAGIDEAKEELAQIVEFLRDPSRYLRLGARIPHGILLTGPPGTGKTLLARALAGEAQVPFFSISASEFVELYVGVGASRVRSLFADAKAAAPAIVFVDELDAIGRSRTAGPMPGGHDEREQTLNQLLTEMDGFDPTIGVIVLAATNRPEILDAALLRPGRFDRRVAIQSPDTAGRRQILDVHARSVPLGPTSTSTGSPPRRPAWSAPTWPTSSTRARCWPPSVSTRPLRWATWRTRWRSSCWEPSGGSCSATRSAAAAPTTRPGTRSSGCCCPAPTRCARCRSSPTARRSG